MRSRDTQRSPSPQGGHVRVEIVDPLILKIRAAVVEVTRVTISLGEPSPQILHLVLQAPFLLPDTAISRHRRFNGLHGAA